ncbi:MAG: hypothetical protein JSS02_00220 [Planctomycetes bacterium]|nr:hypothetical protein [Planctomycetota bacterium]
MKPHFVPTMNPGPNRCWKLPARHWWLGLIVLSLGCGGPQPTPGGTIGTLQIAGQPASDMHVTVFDSAEQPLAKLGFGITDQDGAFELFTNEAKGSLWLKDGEYVFTVESAGSPLTIPAEYQQPETSPLRITWSESQQELNLNIPGESSR